MNPRLENCVEQYLQETLYENKDKIILSINNLSTIDTSILPKNISSKISEAHITALSVFIKEAFAP